MIYIIMLVIMGSKAKSTELKKHNETVVYEPDVMNLDEYDKNLIDPRMKMTLSVPGESLELYNVTLDTPEKYDFNTKLTTWVVISLGITWFFCIYYIRMQYGCHSEKSRLSMASCKSNDENKAAYTSIHNDTLPYTKRDSFVSMVSAVDTCNGNPAYNFIVNVSDVMGSMVVGSSPYKPDTVNDRRRSSRTPGNIKCPENVGKQSYTDEQRSQINAQYMGEYVNQRRISNRINHPGVKNKIDRRGNSLKTATISEKPNSFDVSNADSNVYNKSSKRSDSQKNRNTSQASRKNTVKTSSKPISEKTTSDRDSGKRYAKNSNRKPSIYREMINEAKENIKNRKILAKHISDKLKKFKEQNKHMEHRTSTVSCTRDQWYGQNKGTGSRTRERSKSPSLYVDL